MAVSPSSESAAKGTGVYTVRVAGARRGGPGLGEGGNLLCNMGLKKWGPEVKEHGHLAWTGVVTWVPNPQLPVGGWATTLTLGSNVQGRLLGHQMLLFLKYSIKPY